MDVQSRTAVLVVMTAGMRHGLVVVALSLASVQAGARGLTQQSVVDSAVACTACRLDVSSPIRLRGVVDGGLPNTAAVVQRAADGTLYVVYDGEYSSIVAHRADGVFAGQRFGRRGGGPAEYSRIKHAVLTADTIRAFDYLLSRRTDINRVSGALIRTVPFPDHARLIVLADGRTVLGGSIRSRSTAGQPLHIFDSTGKWQRSWGVNNPALHPGLGPLLTRRMAPVAGTTFWAAPVNEYRLELWNADGALLRSLVAPRAWFPRWTEQVAFVSDQPPTAIVTDVAVAEDGLLWVLLQAPHPNWRDALTGESDEHGLRRVRWDRPYVVAILEVIDPSRGHVVARHRFTHGLWGLTSAHVVSNTNGVWRTWTDETTGEPRVEVTVIRLRGR